MSDDEQDLQHTIDVYNTADEIVQQYKSSKKLVKKPPVKFTYFAGESKCTDYYNEVISDSDLSGDSSEDSTDSDCESDCESDCSSDDEEAKISEQLMFPEHIDQFIYRFQDDFEIVEIIMNKVDRKVYSCIRKNDLLPVIIIVCEYEDNECCDPPKEVSIMSRLNGHKNIVHTLGWVRLDHLHYAFIQEKHINCEMTPTIHGDLYLISKLMQGLLGAVAFLHENKIAHLDIAQDNVLWDPVKETCVLIDFDTAATINKKGFTKECGRNHYDSPEKAVPVKKDKKYVKKDKKSTDTHTIKTYNESSDLWACGVILWMLLNEKNHSPSPRKLQTWIQKVRKKNKHKKFQELDLLIKLLTHDHTNRITAEQALKHTFITETPRGEDYIQIKSFVYKLLHMKKELFQLDPTISVSDTDSESDATESDEEPLYVPPFTVEKPVKAIIAVETTLPMKEIIAVETTLPVKEIIAVEPTLPVKEIIAVEPTLPVKETIAVETTLPMKEIIAVEKTLPVAETLAEDTIPIMKHVVETSSK
jgi:hypothetical protein